MAIRVQASYIQGFSGDVAPPFARFYSGGDNELRGFDVRAATPYAFIPVRQNITLTNPGRHAGSDSAGQLHAGQHHDPDPDLPPRLGRWRRQGYDERLNIAFRLPARCSSPSSTTSTSLRWFANPSCGKAWKAPTSSIPRSMAAPRTSMALARADSRFSSST